MLTPFSWGVGGRLGTGRQYMSWISIDDLVGAIHHAIATPSLQGPVNATAPNPVTNAELTKTLARVLCRPVGPPVPNFALNALMDRLGFGGKGTPHGMRAAFSTHFNGRHASADVIERCLAHVSANAVRAAYNRHAYRKERRAMLQQWADHLDLLHKKHGKSAALPPALRTTHRKTHHSSQNRRSRRSQRKAA